MSSLYCPLVATVLSGINRKKERKKNTPETLKGVAGNSQSSRGLKKKKKRNVDSPVVLRNHPFNTALGGNVRFTSVTEIS